MTTRQPIIAAPPAAAPGGDVVSTFCSVANLVPQLYNRLCTVVQDELKKHGRDDINPVQALLLYNLDNHEIMAGELRGRGFYLGTNASYNLEKLVKLGLLERRNDPIDGRKVRIRLTTRGRVIRDMLAALFEKQGQTVAAVGGISAAELEALKTALQRLDRFWLDHLLFRL